jgi:hypothetical protein
VNDLPQSEQVPMLSVRRVPRWHGFIRQVQTISSRTRRIFYFLQFAGILFYNKRHHFDKPFTMRRFMTNAYAILLTLRADIRNRAS